jgi:hypothetical protein
MLRSGENAVQYSREASPSSERDRGRLQRATPCAWHHHCRIGYGITPTFTDIAVPMPANALPWATELETS